MNGNDHNKQTKQHSHNTERQHSTVYLGFNRGRELLPHIIASSNIIFIHVTASHNFINFFQFLFTSLLFCGYSRLGLDHGFYKPDIFPDANKMINKTAFMIDNSTVLQ